MRSPLPAFARAACLVLAVSTASQARARRQEDDDRVVAEAPAPIRTGKPVAFDPRWLEPFFADGAVKSAVDLFRAEEWGPAEAAFARALKKLPAGAPERMAAQYLQALAGENQAKWSEAGAAFEELYRTYPKLAAYHAFHAARCRLRRGDATGALDWAARVPKGSVPEADSVPVRIEALRTLGRWQEVLAAASAALERPSSATRAELLYKKAEATEKLAAEQPNGVAEVLADVTAIYRRVWAEAPLEAWADRAAERLNALAQTLPAFEANLVRTHTAAEWVARGMSLFDRNRNTESEAAFAAALAAPGLDRDLECRARFHRAQSVWKQRQRARAAPLFDDAEAACGRVDNRDLHAKALYQAGRCFGAMTFQSGLDEAQIAANRQAALARFARLESEHPEHSYADDARVRAAELVADGGDEAESNRLLAAVVELYPGGDLVNEALWRLAFAAWRGGRYDDALHWLDETLRLVPHEDIWYAEGRTPYWKARVLERQGKPDEARAWYERAVREYPLSVYALLSLSRLREAAPQTRSALIAELRAPLHRPARWTFAARPLFGEAGFQRAVELGRMGLGGDARRELGKLGLSTSGEKHARPGEKEQPPDEDLLWITAILLDRGGVWSASHSIPRYTLTGYRLEYPKDLGEAKWKLAYPRAFPQLVGKNAQANDLPEALQLAIMREESAFSPRIESFANAIGLTQMLIKTARRFSGKAPVNREVLMDPARNLEYGSRFLGFLWKHFGGAAPLAIAGYNAGEAAVDSWLGERGNLAMDEFMESVRVDETRNYTKRVLASYFAYSWLYAENPVPDVPLTLPGRPPETRTADKR
ncbi:MAG TPA: transglycosylase SLT domain-containing protein [Polyangia bacterium]|nr:transglycosylase SLT domain-containing protein [Polyangia bacterium]